MTMASLLCICVLCKAGCKVLFTDETCCVSYKDKVSLTGYKDSKSNLWTLQILQETLWTTPPLDTATTRHDPCFGSCPTVPLDLLHITLFSYHCTTKTNALQFMHQSICNLPSRSLIKAINAGFLNGTLHLNAKSVQKYFTPSPAASKGHMKRIRSITPKPVGKSCLQELLPPILAPINQYHPMLGLIPDNNSDGNSRADLITDVDNEFIANVFYIGAFTNKNTGVMYNDCTYNFPFM